MPQQMRPNFQETDVLRDTLWNRRRSWQRVPIRGDHPRRWVKTVRDSGTVYTRLLMQRAAHRSGAGFAASHRDECAMRATLGPVFLVDSQRAPGDEYTVCLVGNWQAASVTDLFALARRPAPSGRGDLHSKCHLS